MALPPGEGIRLTMKARATGRMTGHSAAFALTRLLAIKTATVRTVSGKTPGRVFTHMLAVPTLAIDGMAGYRRRFC